ncbi:MAG: type II secretion system protein GspD [Armatimonadetes bacterium]|nr:type II secretion system protein GspD [Armatimonadota bacterium]
MDISVLRRGLGGLGRAARRAGKVCAAGGDQAAHVPLVRDGHTSRCASMACAVAFSLLAGVWSVGAAAAPAAGMAQVSVSVQKLPDKICVRLKAGTPLGRHFLRSVGRAGDVALRIPDCTAKPVRIPVSTGSIRAVSARPTGNDLVVTVERDVAGGYRSAYTANRREIVLEVDMASPAAARELAVPGVARATVPKEAPLAPAPRVLASQRPIAPAAAPVAVVEPRMPRAPIVLPASDSGVRVAEAPPRVAMLPGTWRVLGAQAPSRRLVTLDFVNADIQDVLKALAIQSGANILIAPKVEGKVTVGLRNVTPEQALEYIVRLSSLAYGREDDTYVVCTRDQIKDVFPPGTRGEILFPPPVAEASPGVAVGQPAGPPKVSVVRLERLEAAKAVPLVQKLAPAVQIETPDPKLAVLIGDDAQVAAAEMAIRTLESSLPPLPARSEGVPPKLSEEFEIEVYSLRHVNAYDAGRLLKGFMTSRILPEVVVVPAPAPAYPAPEDDKGRAPIGQRLGDTDDALLNLLAGKNVASGSEAAGKTPPGAPEATEKAGTVLIPEGSTTNTLLLIGARPDIAKVKDYLDRIDVAPKQVMIDVKVTDVSLSDAEQLGITWNWTTLGIQEIAPEGSETIPRMQFGRFGHAPMVFNATLEALLKTNKARLLANPRVAVLDGRTASIHVGDTVRYLAQRTSGINGTTVTIGEESVGVVVSVSPRVGGDDVIVLDVKPKVNVITGFTPTGDGGQVPNTSERSVETVVRLRDGETLAIGGLIRDDDTVTMQKVPGLGDLPILGELFKYRNRQRSNSEVLIFITPTIVPDIS